MRKLLSLVLAFAMILGLFAFPVSADATTYQQVGQELVGLGVLKGVDAKGTLAEMQNLTREQALVVLTRLMGQEDKALATDAQPGFTDVPATHWSAKYVAYAKLQGWTNGTSETEFGLGQNVTTKQVVTLMMRALGYTADWSKEDVMMKAKELGLLEGVSATTDDAIIRGELFIVMKNTLYTKPMGEKIELIYKLGLAENPIPATLEVVDVKADNLKEVTVEFNQEVDKDTLKDAFKFVGSSHGTLTIRPQADGKTVVVSLEKELTNKKTYKLQVSKAKTLSGLMVEKVVKEFKAEDNQIPVVESVVVTGPKNLQITFSEPIKGFGTAKVALVSSKSYSTGKLGEVQGDERKVNVDTFALKDGSTYKVLVQGFQDYAKYKNIDAEIEFEYAKITNAPTVEVVSATQEYVELKFDRPVKGLTLDHFYHTYSAWKPYSLYTSVEKMNEAIDKASGKLGQEKTLPITDTAVVRFIGKVKDFKPSSNNEHPLPVGEVEFNIVGKVGSKKVEDNWKNQLQDTELKVSVTADKTAPVVESVEVSGETEVTVTFSKKVDLNKDNYEILKEDGSKVTGTTIKEVKSEGTTGVKLVLSNDKLVGKTIILNIKNVRDNTINQNKLVGTESFTITFGDKKFDGAKEASFYAGKDLAKIRIAFEEAVDSDSATNVKNYKLTRKGKLVDATFEASMINDKIVELIFTEEEWNKVAGKPSTPIKTTAFIADLKVVMSNEITDVAGNKIAQFQKELPVLGSASAPTLKSAVANSTSEIKLTFSEAVDVEDGFGASNFKIKKGPAEYDVVVNDVTHDEKTITITLDTDKKLLPYDLKDGVALTITYTGKTIQNVAGGSLVWVDKEIEDKIKPEAVKLPNIDKLSDVAGTLYENAPFQIPGTDADEKQAFLDNLEKEKPAVALIWDGNKYVAKLFMTEAIDVNSLSNGTFELTADSGNYKWAPVDLRPTLEGSDKVIVVEYKLPKAKDFEKEIFTDLTFKQLTVLKDKAGNEFKLEEAAPVQFAPTKANNETAQLKAVNDIITAKKAALTTRLSSPAAKIFDEKTADVLETGKENFSKEYADATKALVANVADNKATLAEANEELKKLNDLEADIDAKVDMFVASTGINVVFTKHNADNLKTVISGVGADSYRIQVLDNKDKKYLSGAKAADVAGTTVVALADGEFLFGTALTGANADSYVLVTKVDASGNVLAQMTYQVKDIAK